MLRKLSLQKITEETDLKQLIEKETIELNHREVVTFKITYRLEEERLWKQQRVLKPY